MRKCAICGSEKWWAIDKHHLIPGSIVRTPFWRLYRVREQYTVFACACYYNRCHTELEAKGREIISRYREKTNNPLAETELLNELRGLIP